MVSLYLILVAPKAHDWFWEKLVDFICKDRIMNELGHYPNSVFYRPFKFFRSEYLSIEPYVEQQVFRFED